MAPSPASESLGLTDAGDGYQLAHALARRGEGREALATELGGAGPLLRVRRRVDERVELRGSRRRGREVQLGPAADAS